MAKTPRTKEVEKALFDDYLKSQALYGAFEVPMFNRLGVMKDSERPDFVTIDNKTTIRCYEVKVTLSDLTNGQPPSDCGHFNYLVIPEELYKELEELEKDTAARKSYSTMLFKGFGVMIYKTDNNKKGYLELTRNPKRRQLDFSQISHAVEKVMKAASRDAKKYYKGYFKESK